MTVSSYTLDSEADLRAVSNVTYPLYLSSIEVVFSPLHIHSFEDHWFTAAGLGCLFFFIFVTFWTKVVFFLSLLFSFGYFFFFFFVNASHTHSSSLGTLFWDSDVVQFLILFFWVCRKRSLFFFSFLTTCNSKMTFHAIYREKKNRVTAEGIVCFHFVLHCLLKKQILKNKIKKATKNK